MNDDIIRLSLGIPGPSTDPDFDGIRHIFFYDMTTPPGVFEHSFVSICGQVLAEDYHINHMAYPKDFMKHALNYEASNLCPKCKSIAEILIHAVDN